MPDLGIRHHVRKLTKDLTIRFRNREYRVTRRGKEYRLRGAAVTVCQTFDGSVTVLRDGRALPTRLLGEGEAATVEDEKTVVRRVDRIKAEQRSRPTYKPARTTLGGGRGSRTRAGPRRDEARAHRPWASVAPLPAPKADAVPPQVYGTRRPKGTFLLCVYSVSIGSLVVSTVMTHPLVRRPFVASGPNVTARRPGAPTGGSSGRDACTHHKRRCTEPGSAASHQRCALGQPRILLRIAQAALVHRRPDGSAARRERIDRLWEDTRNLEPPVAMDLFDRQPNASRYRARSSRWIVPISNFEA